MQVGDVIEGKYELKRLLGEGGMGKVFEARHLRIGRRLALKALHPDLAKNKEMVERFMREAQAAAAIGSEHIVDITDADVTADGVPFIVMEYLEGQDLAQLIHEQAPLETALAADIAWQLCIGLGAAHERGIVHRDLKPQNVFVVARPQGPEHVRIKVLDFGIAKFRDALAQEIPELTASGVIMGTPYYMAPEQARGARDVDHRADVYAAGVILFEMLAGRRPFDAANYNELIVRVATTEPVPLLALRPGLDATLAGVVRRAMDRDPARRFQSMAELARALEPIAGRPPGPRPGEAMAAPAAPAEIGVAPTMPPPAAAGAAPPPPRTAIASAQPATTRALPKTVDSGAPRGRGRGRWALAAGLVAALGAAAGFAVLHSGPGDGPGDDGRTAAPLPVSEPAAAKAPASQPPDDAVRLEAPPSPLGPEPPRPPASLAPEDAALVGPGNASKLGNACFLHFRAGRYEPGRAACYRGLDLDASDNVRGALYYNLCMIDQAEGRLEQARWYCRRSLEVRPGNTAVIKRLAALQPPD